MDTLLISALILMTAPMIARNGKVAAAYVVLQTLYAAAVGFCFLVIAVVNMSSSHGPSRSAIVLPVAVLLVFVVVPVVLTVRGTSRPPRGY